MNKKYKASRHYLMVVFFYSKRQVIKELKNNNIKDLLKQYNDLIKEKQEIQAAIDKIQRELGKMEAEGYTEKDSVTGGDGGKQHFVVEGFPYPAYSRKKTLIILRQRQQMDVKEKIDAQINLIEQCINEIDNSRMRRLITLRYIEGLSWVQVARKMGKHHTADGCRMAVERFLAKI